MAGRIAYYGGIVTDGLVLHLDAAKRDSYPGSGTVWRDLSGNGNNGTLVNGPTFDRDSGNGSLVFDGVNDYVNCGEFNKLSTNFTFNIWVVPVELSFNTIISGGPSISGISPLNTGFYFAYDNRNSQNHLYLYLGGSERQPSPGHFNPIEGNPYQIGIIVANNVATFFVNNNLYSSVSNIGTLDLSTLNIQNLIIGARNYYSGLNYVECEIYTTQIYNRALTPSEISQNYNALKSRFGL